MQSPRPLPPVGPVPALVTSAGDGKGLNEQQSVLKLARTHFSSISNEDMPCEAARQSRTLLEWNHPPKLVERLHYVVMTEYYILSM